MLTRFLKPYSLCFSICLLPLLGIVIDMIFDNLGPDPIQALHIRLGDWSLRLLWLTLFITPLQTFTQWRGMAQYRKLLGLYTFFYASLHVIVYVWIDQGLVWGTIFTDVIESSYIWFGFLAYLIVLALALTTPMRMVRLLGRNWKKLHRTIYIASIAVIIHYYWQLKGNLAEPLFYLIILALLLGFRLAVWFKNRKFNKMMIPTTRKIRVVKVDSSTSDQSTAGQTKAMVIEVVDEDS